MSEVLVAPHSVSGPTPSRFADLKDQVALILGRQLDSQSLFRCGQFINRAIKELNTRPWRAMLTGGSPITTVIDQTDYALDAPFYRESKCVRLDANLDQEYALRYIDWEVFISKFDKLNDRGKPYLYTLRNVDNDGLLTVYPIPNDAITTLGIEYYARIPQLVNNDDTLLIPIEFENYIILRGQYYLMDLFHHERSELKGQQSVQALSDLIRQDELHPDKNVRIRLPNPVQPYNSTLYIKAT